MLMQKIGSFIFSFEKTDFFRNYRILGIRIRFPRVKKIVEAVRSLQSQQNAIAYQTQTATRGNLFLWANEKRFTAKEYEWFATQHFYEQAGFYPNLKNPQRFSEKTTWLKLYYRHRLYERITDKLEFKKYISEVLGDGWTVPLLGVWDDAADIDFARLPERFVLKITTGGGGKYGIYIVKDKAKIDEDQIRYMFNEWLQEWSKAYYHEVAEPKNITTRIIAEEYLEGENHELRDYKFLCFHGEPKAFWVDCDRFGEHRKNMYDMEGHLMDVSFIYPPCKERAQELLPRQFDKMVEIARKLSAPFPHIRVDFYEVDDRIYVGELTFHSAAGYSKWRPMKYDYLFGSYLDLSRLDAEGLANALIPNRGVHAPCSNV